MSADCCPVCGRETDDMRHVDVECFYRVNESAPHLHTRERLEAAEPDRTYLGRLVRLPAGEERHYDYEKTGPNTTTMTARWEPGPALPDHEPDAEGLYRYRAVPHYGTRCCKSCRADFIGLFLRWSRGAFASPPPEPEAERLIPVRENGALRYLTPEQWRARRAEEDQP